MKPRPRHRKQAKYGFALSSPDPLQSGHRELLPLFKGTKPFPEQQVQVRVLIAPVPQQWAHALFGNCTKTLPLPPQTQQLESQDITPKGSLPLPRQKRQVFCSTCVLFFSCFVMVAYPLCLEYYR